MAANAHSVPSALASEEVNCLARAFAVFTDAADSLQHSYTQLQNEIGRLREELQRANLELEQERESAHKLQALAEVSTLLAHEIRNPLGSLELFARLLADSTLSAEQFNWAQHIQAGLRTLSGTVNNVLSFHAEGEPLLLPTDAGELLHWAAEFLGPLAVQKGVRFEVQNELSGARIRAAAHSLHQVILNLALNALQFLPEHGCLLLAGRRIAKAGKVEIQVRDNGPGIALGEQRKIFEAGFTTRAGSAGLGLAVCRKIVTQHHGTIAVDSEVGRGAVFMLRFDESMP